MGFARYDQAAILMADRRRLIWTKIINVPAPDLPVEQRTIPHSVLHRVDKVIK
jgi:hypothetical protein